jgi:hypothetical protein
LSESWSVHVESVVDAPQVLLLFICFYDSNFVIWEGMWVNMGFRELDSLVAWDLSFAAHLEVALVVAISFRVL